MQNQQDVSTGKPLSYLVETMIDGKQYTYLSTLKPSDEWAVVTPLSPSSDIEAAQRKANPGILDVIRKKSWRMWWHLWTGDHSIFETRRRIEGEARRFGGIVLWDDSQ